MSSRCLTGLVACGVFLGVVSAPFAGDEAGAPKKKPDPEKMFTAKDKDGDGKLSLDEFVGKRDGDAAEKAKAQFAKLDKDGDGFVTKDEMMHPGGGHEKKGEKKGKKKEQQ